MPEVALPTLEELEAVVERVVRSFYEAGKALEEIRDRRLWRGKYNTFDMYLMERWGFTKQYASKLIMGANTVRNLSKNVPSLPLPNAERQVRPISGLDPDIQVQAWSTSVDLAQGRPTLGIVDRVAKAINADIKAEFSKGDKIIVYSEKSKFHGQTIEVLEIDGLIVKGKTRTGAIEPFLVNELRQAKPKSERRQWSTKTKEDHFASAQSALEIAKAREVLLEQMIYRLITAARNRSITMALIEEAESLIQ